VSQDTVTLLTFGPHVPTLSAENVWS